ncbi:MAG TPA: hypothetical protein VGC92_02205 [Phenylobacterium sp.]|jgi:hypothetical protein
MAYFGVEGWVALSCLAGAGILAMLHVLATCFSHERDKHDLRVRAAELRSGYAARLAVLRAADKDVIEVEVDEEATTRAAEAGMAA